MTEKNRRRERNKYKLGRGAKFEASRGRDREDISDVRREDARCDAREKKKGRVKREIDKKVKNEVKRMREGCRRGVGRERVDIGYRCQLCEVKGEEEEE